MGILLSYFFNYAKHFSLTLVFYFNAGWWLFDIAIYLGGLFFCLALTIFFVLAFKLWESNFSISTRNLP
jgi:hypothetical protein